jgi:hypothetical protein
MRSRKLLAGAACAILLAGCAAKNVPDASTQSRTLGRQTRLAQTDVSRYVAAMSDQPGQVAFKHRCGHARSWDRIQGLSTANDQW